MKRSNLWRSVSALLMAGCICCTMPSCSDDDAPAVIEAAQPTASDYELNEAGEVALEFEVVPGDAQVDEVTIVGGNSAFESKGFTPKGNGKWVLNAKVIDFTQIKQDNAITLSIAQTGGTPQQRLVFRVRPVCHRKQVPTGTAQRVQLLQCRQRQLVYNLSAGSPQTSAAGKPRPDRYRKHQGG